MGKDNLKKENKQTKHVNWVERNSTQTSESVKSGYLSSSALYPIGPWSHDLSYRINSFLERAFILLADIQYPALHVNEEIVAEM